MAIRAPDGANNDDVGRIWGIQFTINGWKSGFASLSLVTTMNVPTLRIHVVGIKFLNVKIFPKSKIAPEKKITHLPQPGLRHVLRPLQCHWSHSEKVIKVKKWRNKFCSICLIFSWFLQILRLVPCSEAVEPPLRIVLYVRCAQNRGTCLQQNVNGCKANKKLRCYHNNCDLFEEKNLEPSVFTKIILLTFSPMDNSRVESVIGLEIYLST